MKIVHVASINLSEETGMGRIACNWKKAFEKQGHEFIHVGNKECSKAFHPILWGKQAANYLKIKGIQPDLILVHEPASGYFFDFGVPVVLFSHGIEARGWKIEAQFHYRNQTFKSLFLPEYFRYKSNAIGLKKANKLLLSNSEDVDYVINHFNRKIKDVIIFKNGYYEENIPQKRTPEEKSGQAPQYKAENSDKTALEANERVVFLFNASWLERKGKKDMIAAFIQLQKEFPNQWQLILAGIGEHKNAILSEFPSDLHQNLDIIPRFSQAEETKLYERADVFLLPSYFEGQSLALTQAMASGLCCICSDNCGQHDFIKHEDNGLLFKTGNAVDLAKKLKWVLQNKSLIPIYAKHAQQTVKSYTWDKVGDEVVEVCTGLVNASKSRHYTEGSLVN
jgi:glycosyltransferase involved in cell wall biosynthesis